MAMDDFTSAVTAGNVPMVMVKAKHTARANTQIYKTGVKDEERPAERNTEIYLFLLHLHQFL